MLFGDYLGFAHIEIVIAIVSSVDICHWKKLNGTVKMAVWVQALDSIAHWSLWHGFVDFLVCLFIYTSPHSLKYEMAHKEQMHV